MHLQRYLLKNKEKGIYIGEHFTEHSWDFDWKLGLDKIGVENNLSTEGESFIGGFLVSDDELLIVPSKNSPSIKRMKKSYGVMSGHDAGEKEVYDLIQLIQGQEITHAYQSSEYADGSYPRILTFSPIAPPSDLYILGKIMPIEMDYKSLETDRIVESMFGRLRR